MRENTGRGTATAVRAVQNNTISSREKRERMRYRRSRMRIHQLVVGAILVIFAGVAIASVSCHVRMTELRDQVEAERQQLRQLESEAVSLSAKKENNVDLGDVEDYAKNVLGLVKIDRSQEEYLELQKTDQVEVNEASSGVNKLGSRFVKSFNAILSFLK